MHYVPVVAYSTSFTSEQLRPSCQDLRDHHELKQNSLLLRHDLTMFRNHHKIQPLCVGKLYSQETSVFRFDAGSL